MILRNFSTFTLLFIALHLLVTPTYSGQNIIITNSSGNFYGRVVKQIIETAYQRAGIDYEIVTLPSKRAVTEFLNSTADATLLRIASLGDNHPQVIRIDPPLTNLESAAFVLKGSDISVESLSDLKKYNVAIVNGTLLSEDLAKHAKSVQSVKTLEQTFNMLMLGRVDIAIHARLTGQVKLDELGMSGIVSLKKPLRSAPMHHYIHQNHKQAAMKISKELHKMKSTSELENMLTKKLKEVLGNVGS